MDDSEFTEYYFEGFKNTGPVFCDSAWLKHYLQRLEWDVDVQTYFQPRLQIQVPYGTFEHEVDIDLWINRTDGQACLVHFQPEIFDNESVENPIIQSECVGFCQANNLVYKSVKRGESHPEPETANIDHLWKYAHWKLHLNHLWAVNRFFADEPAPNLGKLKQMLKSFDLDENWAYTLIFQRMIIAGIEHHRLSDLTPLLKGKAEIRVEHMYAGNGAQYPIINFDEEF